MCLSLQEDVHASHAVLPGICLTNYGGPDMCISIKIKLREQNFDAQGVRHIPANQAKHRSPGLVNLPLKRLLAFLQNTDTVCIIT